MTPRRGFGVAVACTLAGTLTGVLLVEGLFATSPDLADAFSLYAVDFEPTVLGFLRNNLAVLLIVAAGMGLFTSTTLYFIGIPLGFRLFTDPHLYLIVPHGLVEFPSLWIAGAAGFYPPAGLIAYARGRREEVLTDEEVVEFLRLVVIAVGLMVLAAVVETTVTRWLAEATT